MDLATLRTFVETDLEDAPLGIILAAADEDLTAAVGPDVADVCNFETLGDLHIFLGRPAASITSVTETVGDTMTPLAANDYRLWGDKVTLERLSSGTHPSGGWCGLVAVSFTPADLNKRTRALVHLVQLDLDHRPGATREVIGDHDRSQQSYAEARAEIIAGARSVGIV